MDEDKDISIVIEAEDYFDGDDLYVQKEYLYIDGKLVDSDGNHILAILEYLGYNATVDRY